MRYLVVFAFSTICLLFLSVAQAQNHVGIILSGQDNDCSVVHQGVSYPCKERLRLYVGDEVHKRPSVKMLKIKWAPYFNGEIKNNVSMVVVAEPAEKMKGNISVSGIKQYISDFVKPVSYGAVPLVTRSGKKASFSLPWIIPVRATLITDYALKLSGPSGDNEVKSIAVLDGKGEKVFEETMKNGKPVFLLAAEWGINPEQPYQVCVVKQGITQKIDVALMNEATRAEVMKGITDIEGENSSSSETLFRKIAYLQLISDAYPEKIDLYWLGHQLLQEYPQRFTKEEEGIARQFIQRYHQHNQ